MKKWRKTISDYGDSGYYISAYYGRDDQGTPTYVNGGDPNVYGGPNNPLKTFDKFLQHATIDKVGIFDSGLYTTVSNNNTIPVKLVGDGSVFFRFDAPQSNVGEQFKFSGIYNCDLLMFSCSVEEIRDSRMFFCKTFNCSLDSMRTSFYNSEFLTNTAKKFVNSTLIGCSDVLNANFDLCNSICINSLLTIPNDHKQALLDYNIIHGKLRHYYTENDYEDIELGSLKVDYDLFTHSYSLNDVGLSDWRDLFNNVAEVDIHNFTYTDFTLKKDIDHKVQHGGKDGYFIGAQPRGFSFSASELWNTYKKTSSNLTLDSGFLITTDGSNDGTYESNDIALGESITVNANNMAYHFTHLINGAFDARIGGVYETIDYTTEQRSILDIELDFRVNGSWIGFKSYEINENIRIDSLNRSNLNNDYDKSTETKLNNVDQFRLKFTMRKE